MAAKKRAKRIKQIQKDKIKYPLYKESINRLLYWTTILVLAVCNFLISVLIVPLLLVVNRPAVYITIGALIFILVTLTNRISSILKMGLEVNSLLIAVIYVGAFMLPYLYYSNKLRHDKKATFK